MTESGNPKFYGYIEDQRESPIEAHPELHHYTNFVGLKGIIQSNSLWATSYRFLNDSSEIEEMRRHLEDVLAPKIDAYIRKLKKESRRLDIAIAKNGGPRHLARDLARSFSGRPYDALLRGKGPSNTIHLEPFIACFCSHSQDTEYERDNGLLSQWRGYAGGGGVAIVFDTALLSGWLNNVGSKSHINTLFLSEVFYDQGIDMFKKKFQILLAEFERYAFEFIEASYLTGDHSEVIKLIQNLIFEFIVNASRFKHCAFAEEREVRIVALPVDLKNVQVRGEAGIRYISLLAENSRITDAISRFILGPGVEQDKYEADIHALLGDRIPIVRSKTPFLTQARSQ